jgi:hypothetical protein
MKRERTMANSPIRLAFTMLTRSGTLAKRQMPRYRPTYQNTSPCAIRTSRLSTDHSGGCAGLATIA